MCIRDRQEEAPPPDFGPKKKIKQVAKAQNNAALGQQIHQEYQRLKGVTTPEKLPQKEAETVGDVFKELWAADNPGLVRRIRDPQNQQVYFELTPMGEDVLASGQQTRKTLFPSKNVKPSKIPLEKGRLLGDVGQQVKNVQGAVGKQEFSKVINDAMSNLAQVPNVVNKNRLKVLYSTVLPVMQGLQQDPQTALTSWEAEINNIGESKMAQYNANEAQALADPENNAPYSAMEEMEKAVKKLAFEVNSIAENKDSANYLSYAVQGFQGRISPQQTYFNPTTSKAVRFVTTNAVPAMAMPGNRIDRNLRQMYAMMLVKGADAKLPDQREIMLKGASSKLERWGDRLTQALTMSDADADAVSEAFAQGLTVADPNFPQVQGFQLDPAQDADLIRAIEKKGRGWTSLH